MGLTSLRFEHLSRRFGRIQAVTDATGAVESGGVLLVRGPNGSGKSTLLRCLAGLLRPDGGTIAAIVDDRPLSLEERIRGCGFLAPALGLYRELTVLENLELLARLRNLPREPVPELMATFRLPPKRRAGELSSGMLQRLRWASALLHAPRIWLLDEPLEHLDPAGSELCLGLLARHLETGGVAVVASPTPFVAPGKVDELVLAG